MNHDTMSIRPKSLFHFEHVLKKYRNHEGVLSFSGNLQRETEKAYLFAVGSGSIWLPKSAVSLNDKGQAIIASWFKYNDEQFKIIEPVSTFYS